MSGIRSLSCVLTARRGGFCGGRLPTPVTNGRAVYAYFGAEGFYAYDRNGKFLWKYDPGKIQTIGMGPGASPVLAGELLILQCDSSDQKSKVVALNRRNGELVWRTERTTDATW